MIAEEQQPDVPDDFVEILCRIIDGGELMVRSGDFTFTALPEGVGAIMHYKHIYVCSFNYRKDGTMIVKNAAGKETKIIKPKKTSINQSP